MTEVKGVSQKSLSEKVLISAKISEDENMTEYMYLIKDEDINEYYLIETFSGWKQITETEKTWDLLLSFKYYVKKDVVPLIYFILSTNPTQLHDIFGFLHDNRFIMIEQDEQ